VKGPNDIVSSDFDGDGKLDLAISGTPAYILLGNGNGTLQNPVVAPAAIDAGLVVAGGDFNGKSAST